MTNRIVILIELLLAIGLFFGYIQPIYSNSIIPLQQQIAKTENAKQVTVQYVNQESTLEGKYHSTFTQDNTARINIFLPSDSYKIHFLYDINTLAATAGFTLKKYSEQDNNNNQNGIIRQTLLHITTITLSGTGPYQNFRTFLNALERSLRLVDVTNIKITAPTNNKSVLSKLPKYPTYVLKLNIYWLPNTNAL